MQEERQTFKISYEEMTYQQISEVGKRLDRLEKRLDDTRQELNQRMDRLENRMDKLEEKLETTRKEFNARMDKQEDKINRLADKIDELRRDLKSGTNHGQILNITAVGVLISLALHFFK